MQYIFTDEAGNFDFSSKGSKYFIVVAVSMRDCSIGSRLIDLRHALAMESVTLLDGGFHATEDRQHVRDRVYSTIQGAPLSIDAAVLEKRKTYPHIASNNLYLYELAWHLLFKYIAPRRCSKDEELLFIASSIGTTARKRQFKSAIESVVCQHNICRRHATAFWTTSSHPCLQIADYCAWAVQRWKERGDDRSYTLISSQVTSCFEPFASSQIEFY